MPAPADDPACAGDDVTVWRVRPAVSGELATTRAVTQSEREQASRLAPEPRRTYLTARTALRLLLGRALGAAPLEIAFDRTCEHCGDHAHGRPRLSGADEGRLDFSISYSGRVALVAIASGCRVGADVESVEGHGATHRWCFASSERDALASIPPEQRPRVAATSWVRKEALAKGVGVGLALPLADVIVTGPRAGWQLPCANWQLPCANWQIEDVAIDASTVGAIAVSRGDRGARARVTVTDWTR